MLNLVGTLILATGLVCAPVVYHKRHVIHKQVNHALHYVAKKIDPVPDKPKLPICSPVSGYSAIQPYVVTINPDTVRTNNYVNIEKQDIPNLGPIPSTQENSFSYTLPNLPNVQSDNLTYLIPNVEPVIPTLKTPASTVPEPTTWALMIVGFIFTGLTLRKVNYRYSV